MSGLHDDPGVRGDVLAQDTAGLRVLLHTTTSLSNVQQRWPQLMIIYQLVYTTQGYIYVLVQHPYYLNPFKK
jgi:hypothetical protein